MSIEVGTCARCSCEIEQGDLRCAICGLATPATTVTADTLRVSVLRCQGCGAAVSYDAAHRAPACAFCGSVMENEELVDPPEQCELHLPFTVTRKQASAALKQWLGSRGFFRPSDLAHGARLEKLQPISWVGWVFAARGLATWAADSNQGSHRSAWAPHSGEANLEFRSLLVSASRGLKGEEVDELAPSYALSSADSKPIEELDGLAVSIESFDVQRSAARRRISSALEAAARNEIADHYVPGSRVRNVHVSVLLSHLDTERMSFPAWVLAYRYKQKLYRVVISGQDANTITGAAPLAWSRIIGVAVLVAVVLLAIILAIVANA